MKTKNKGFTLVELLVALGLATVVVSIVMSFLIMNVKSYETISTKSDLQYESQYIINMMTEKILESENIARVGDSVNSFMEMSGKRNIKEIIFQYHDKNTGAVMYHIFKLESNGNGDSSLYYGNKADIDSEELELISKNVKELSISTLPTTEVFKATQSLKIMLYLYNGQEYYAEQTLFMRNSRDKDK